ncbi:hypothetical protein E3J62_01300 [candidate division TA06 bacterium]|uniref:Uncharacterized protein n=1 Tax=candidate division TA06 bacterium TaxID=2250710 RepID=A0A523UY87_UNCT6|nr:MAG: hypothetical protein E3J62_01300 [candidate division TA06 bacterium]
MSEEDKRTAVGMSVTLSVQLIGAALAMLTIEAAYVAFVLASRDITGLFVLFGFVTAILFILSIVIAGLGITESRNSGYSGSWRLDVGRKFFNWQAILCLLGLVFLSFTFITGIGAGAPEIESRFSELEERMSSVESRLDSLSSEIGAMQHGPDSTETEINRSSP